MIPSAKSASSRRILLSPKSLRVHDAGRVDYYRLRARYLPEPVAFRLCDGCFGSSLTMLSVCDGVVPLMVGMKCTVTFRVLPFGILKVPLPVTVNGGSRVPTVT